jgi:hypothetical protein
MRLTTPDPRNEEANCHEHDQYVYGSTAEGGRPLSSESDDILRWCHQYGRQRFTEVHTIAITIICE